MKQNNKIILQFIAGVILCLCIISVSVVFTLNFRPLYYADINWLHIPEQSGLDVETIRQNYDALIDYNALFNHSPLNFPTMTMSESGRIHFEEVKNVFDLFGWTAFFALPLSAVSIFLLRHEQKKIYPAIAGILSIVLPIVLGIMVFWNWDYVFVTFHQIVFNNDYWIFDAATDPVITILPDSFFMHCAIMIFSLVILGSITCLLIYRHLRHRQKQ